MKKIAAALFLFSLFLILPGCSTTFGGTVLVLGFRDLVYYVGLAFLFAVIIGVKSNSGKGQKTFWLWFILSLVLTPLAGFIYTLVLFTRRKQE